MTPPDPQGETGKGARVGPFFIARTIAYEEGKLQRWSPPKIES